MFDAVSERLPRTPRRQLSAAELNGIDRMVSMLDRFGANGSSYRNVEGIRDYAANDDQAIVLGIRGRRMTAAA